MTEELIVRKRYPRGLARRRYAKDGKELPCTYVDVGRLSLQKRKEKNKCNPAEFDKMVKKT